MYKVKKYYDDYFQYEWVFDTYEEAKAFYDNICNEYVRKGYVHHTKFYLKKVEDGKEYNV